MNTPLLLTGTIDSSVYNNTGNIIQNVQERLHQYESAITRYITETPFNKIVFIENSGYNFDCQKYVDLATKHGKQFEFINGTICKEEVIKKGKSYGDAFLIHEALLKSEILAGEDCFYKMTGRIFLLNSLKMAKHSEKHQNEFIVYPGIHWCLTYFFKANKEDYLNVLDDVYKECDEIAVKDIEISFYYRLKKATDEGKIKIHSTAAFPCIEGKMGATGQNYSGGKVQQIVLNVMLKLGIFTFDSFLSKTFWKLYQLIKNNKGY